MSDSSSGSDLAEQAERRAGRARVLGLLLVAEPGERELELVSSVSSLTVRTGDLGTLRADYGTVLLREVACHESVFLGAGGQLGGVPAELLALYRRWDFAWEGRWRVAAPDHLGVELLAYAHLCEAEVRAWADDRPERAVEVVEAERQMLRDHLGSWGPVAAEALRRAGSGTVYGEVAGHVEVFLADESARLRPAARHPGVAPLPTVPLPRVGAAGPARVARTLLTPAATGGYLLAAEIGSLASAVGAPWRPADTRGGLRHVVEAAFDSGRLAEFAVAGVSWLRGWQAHWRAALDGADGMRLVLERWLAQTEAARDWLSGLDGAGTAAPVLCVPDEAARARAVAALSAAALVVTIDPVSPALAREVDAIVRIDPGEPAHWEGNPLVGLNPDRAP